MSFPIVAATAVLMLAPLLGGCAGDGDDGFALMQVCRAMDGRGNVYEASDMEMLDALEQAMHQCETAALDPNACVARGCRGAQ
ncbi:MAG TPA: hypothetical protein VES39_11440 [Rhodospirillales bacterium]|nr:hypothetical protein [Rhodospirillales bacterium]